MAKLGRTLTNDLDSVPNVADLVTRVVDTGITEQIEAGKQGKEAQAQGRYSPGVCLREVSWAWVQGQSPRPAKRNRHLARSTRQAFDVVAIQPRNQPVRARRIRPMGAPI